ncbi:hypothetical protein [Vreelandella glaciei]|uniref:hypothetical protein n=1 Tax=Vreelandella glaciei TaxID=186761 RepID=UPI0030023692
MSEVNDIDAALSDKELLHAIRHQLKKGPSQVSLRGETHAPLSAAACDWITLLVHTQIPVHVHLDGHLETRGLALALLADQTTFSPGTTIGKTACWSPLLAVLAHRRLGPGGTRQLLLTDDPASVLNTYGLLNTSALANTDLKSALHAAIELPFDEALAFASWLPSGPSQP